MNIDSTIDQSRFGKDGNQMMINEKLRAAIFDHKHMLSREGIIEIGKGFVP